MAWDRFAIASNEEKGELDNIQYLESGITKYTSIIRDKISKSASLKIDFSEEWSLFAGTSVEEIDYTQPIAKGQGRGIFPLTISDPRRYYFVLATANEKVILSEQHLPMAGGYNFRDLGGYKTQDGRRVKWGKIFRSDDLHNLNDVDLAYLASIPLVSIVDFRSEKEMIQAPDKNPTSVKQNYPLYISPGNLMAVATSKDDLYKLSVDEADALMKGMNTLLVTDPACIDRYRKLFSLLQNEKNVPLMFHCSAGKDRTGMAAALVLSSLGVDEETILDDYLLSNFYLADKYVEYKNASPALKSLFEVKPEFLKSGLDTIKKVHGTIDAFLKSILNVDIEKMRELYLF